MGAINHAVRSDSRRVHHPDARCAWEWDFDRTVGLCTRADISNIHRYIACVAILIRTRLSNVRARAHTHIHTHRESSSSSCCCCCLLYRLSFVNVASYCVKVLLSPHKWYCIRCTCTYLWSDKQIGESYTCGKHHPLNIADWPVLLRCHFM